MIGRGVVRSLVVLVAVLFSSALISETLDVDRQSKKSDALRFPWHVPPEAEHKGLTADATETHDGLLIQRRGYGIAPNAKIDGFLNDVLKRLQMTWPEQPKPAHIFVSPDPSFTAYGTADGAIFVPYGMLESVQSEDELAALISHEYAHILLEHHRSSKLVRMAQIGYGLGMIYLGNKYGKSDLSKFAVLRSFAYNEIALQSVQSALYPNMTRDQEGEADQLGVDLLIRAGYNPIGMATLLKRVGAWEEQQAAANSVREQILLEAAGPLMEQTRSANRVEMRVNAKALAARANSGLSNLMSKVRRQHKPADERLSQMRSYLSASHSDAARPSTLALPWMTSSTTGEETRAFLDGIATALKASEALSASDVSSAQNFSMNAAGGPAADTAYVRYTGVNVALAQGRSKQAQESLTQYVEMPQSLFTQHYLYLDAAQRESPQNALAAWQRSDRILGSPPELLPYAIRINKRAGNIPAASFYYVKCVGRGIADLRGACDKANKDQ